MGSVSVPKRIVVCCDGTWYASDKDDNLPSNVGRMSRAIAKVGRNANGQAVPQISYYQAGVGTGALGPLDKGWQAAFGTGLTQNVMEAYHAIASNWAPGDEIFLFGFSRGAYTARAIAGLISDVGLLRVTGIEFFEDMYRAYQARGDQNLAETPWAKSRFPADESMSMWDEFRKHLQPNVRIRVVGVWDTVGSLGLPDSNWLTKWTGWNKRHEFHNTRLSSQIDYGFHALALDERRGNFRPTLWYLDGSNKTTDLRQCWFPGYHSDVGGGTSVGFRDVGEIDEITFAWMCDQVSPFLQLDREAIDKVLLSRLSSDEDSDSSSSSGPKLDKFSVLRSRLPRWGMGALTDSFSLAYWAAGGEFVRRPGETELTSPDGRPIPRENFHEEIHPSVRHRIESQVGYEPGPLQEKDGWLFKDGSDGRGRCWVKMDRGTEAMRLNEYVMPIGASDDVLGGLERKLAPEDLLKKLDALIGKK